MHTSNKILLVDDDPDDLDIFISVLKEIQPSIEYATACDGIAALDYLFQSVPLPSLIFMDINMPVMNGLECLTVIKKTEEIKNIPVIMLTTSSDPPSVKQSLKMGASLFLTKAASLHDIKNQLQLVMEGKFIHA